jgi:hypothetical protein
MAAEVALDVNGERETLAMFLLYVHRASPLETRKGYLFNQYVTKKK